MIDPPTESLPRCGWWHADGASVKTGGRAVVDAVQRVGLACALVDAGGEVGVADGGRVFLQGDTASAEGAWPLLGYVPALAPEQLGDPGFRRDHGLRFAYVAGAMANGIGSVDIVEAMARAGMIGFFGAAGLSIDRIAAAIDRIKRNTAGLPFGFNLIHSPSEPQAEQAVVDLYLARGVHLVSASAYLDLTLPLVRYRVSGIRRSADGSIETPNKVIAKVSRVEVARKFFSPPPEPMLNALQRDGTIDAEQVELARRIPVAQDLTAEADSGGHTDNRPAIALIPTMLALAEEVEREHGYDQPLRVGAAGGISTPESAAAAFAMGAAYVLTGSINQSCVEAGTSDAVKQMLAEASQADVAMAPAADMFEMGVKVQVLKWGTMFAVRARKLYDLYRAYESLEGIPGGQRAVLERDFFRCSLEEAWQGTRDFFAARDDSGAGASQVARAERDPKHQMALVFRSYLGRSSDWANRGERSRRADYQVWCGPAMGAFNAWVRGTFLAAAANRRVATVGLNLLAGAAAVTRGGWLRAQGVRLPAGAMRFVPRTDEALAALCCGHGDGSGGR